MDSFKPDKEIKTVKTSLTTCEDVNIIDVSNVPVSLNTYSITPAFITLHASSHHFKQDHILVSGRVPGRLALLDYSPYNNDALFLPSTESKNSACTTAVYRSLIQIATEAQSTSSTTKGKAALFNALFVILPCNSI